MQLTKKAYLCKYDISDIGYKLLIIFIGNALCALALNGFIIPNHLISGGVTGIAIMFHYLTNLPTGVILFITNLPIFIIGGKMIDKKFAIYSFISMALISFLLSVTKGIDGFIQLNDILLEALLGGAINGLGMGIMFRNRISQGGVDIIAAIIKTKIDFNIGTSMMLINIIIVSASSIMFGLKPAMYTIIAMYMAYQIVDKVQISFNSKKTVLIISDKPYDLSNEIFNKLHRGATFINGEGAYTKCNKKIVYCTVMSTEVGKLKEIVEYIDPKAFLTISDIKEVKGQGFKNVGF